MGFRLVPKSVTVINDLERRNVRYFALLLYTDNVRL